MLNLLKLTSHKFKILYSFVLFIFILTSCSTVSEPVYEASYEPISDQFGQEAFESSYLSCTELARSDARAAAERLTERQQREVGIDGIVSMNNDRARNQSEGSITVLEGSIQAAQVFDNTLQQSLGSCMMENGFQQIMICTANCSEVAESI